MSTPSWMTCIVSAWLARIGTAQKQPQRDSLLIALPQGIEQDSRIAAVLR